MLFGDKNVFAIETMLDEDQVDSGNVFGRLCLWCENVPLGRIEEENCGLEAFELLSDLIAVVDDLWLEEFDGLSDRELKNRLNSALYGCDEDDEVAVGFDEGSLEEMRGDLIKYRNFDFLTNWGEMFDRGGKSFVFHQPRGSIRIINVAHFRMTGHALVTPVAAFVSAIKDAVTWYRAAQADLKLRS